VQLEGQAEFKEEKMNEKEGTEETEVNEAEDGMIVSRYTRKEAIEDGVLVDVSETAKEAGFIVPVALTQAAFEEVVRVPDDVSWQCEAGRLWDVFTMLRVCCKRKDESQTRHFSVLVQNDEQGAKPVPLKVVLGPGDAGEPTLTVLLPGED
jgi:hypothetical protein